MRNFLWMITLLLAVSAAQAQRVFSVETCPAADASRAMNVSWATPENVSQCDVLYTEASDVMWRKARRVANAEMRLCTTFDSLLSKTWQGEDFVERWTFNKWGATIEKLKPNTDYMYRIVAGDERTPIYRFRTAGAKQWSACVIADFHHYTPLPGRLKAATAMIDTICSIDPSVDWVLHLGDVIAWGGSYSFWKSMYEEPIFRRYMWAGVNGNHDDMSRGYAKRTNHFFRDANHYPRNGYEGEEGVCYYFHYGDALFVMLNNEHMRTDEGLAKAQDWFRKVMASERKKARYVIVCEHYQWFFGNDGKSSQIARWSNLFDEYGVDLALAGNNHIYVRTNALYQGKETDGTTGTVYVQTASSDNERGQGTREWTHNKDVIKKIWTEGEKTVCGMLLDANSKHLTLTLYDRTGKQIDQVKVLAKKR